MHSISEKSRFESTLNIIYSCMIIIFTRIIMSDIIGTGSHFSNEDRSGNKSKHSFFYVFFKSIYVCLKFDIHLLFQPFLFFFFISAVLFHFITEFKQCQIYFKIIIISANNSANHLSPTFSARPNLVSTLL